MVELAIVVTLLVFGLLAYSRAIVSAGRCGQQTRECDLATQAARTTLEQLAAESFAQAFRLYNGTGADDPAGANTGAGASFAVPGLSPVPGDPDGMPGEIVFPTAPNDPGALLENVTVFELGMPRDLNGDGVVDTASHTLDYKLLPVLVRVRWRGVSGTSVVELHTLLANF